jgi:hypothetical protein
VNGLDYALVGLTVPELQETADALSDRRRAAERRRVQGDPPINPALIEAERKAHYYLKRRRRG